MACDGWRSVSRRIACAVLAAFGAGLATVMPALGEPVDYPEILLEVPAPPPADLAAFIESAVKATRVGDKPGVFALRELEDHLADKVRLYVGDVELADGDNFDLVDQYTPWDFVGAFGKLASYDRLSLREADARGARELRELLESGFVGPNRWMHGEMCTAAFGKLEDGALRALADKTKTHHSQWRIAAFPWEEAGFMGRTGPFDWKTGQLLLVDDDMKRPENCCWDYVRKPDGSGGYVSRSYFDPLLRPYLNDHVCFARDGEGAWKITAVGYRTP